MSEKRLSIVKWLGLPLNSGKSPVLRAIVALKTPKNEILEVLFDKLLEADYCKQRERIAGVTERFQGEEHLRGTAEPALTEQRCEVMAGNPLVAAGRRNTDASFLARDAAKVKADPHTVPAAPARVVNRQYAGDFRFWDPRDVGRANGCLYGRLIGAHPFLGKLPPPLPGTCGRTAEQQEALAILNGDGTGYACWQRWRENWNFHAQ